LETIDNEVAIRLAVFAAALVALTLAERGAPRRARSPAPLLRWPANLGLMAVGAALSRLVVPLGAAGAGALAADRGWGLLGLAGIATTPVGLVVAVVALDFAIYGQHVVMHRVPILWRLHRVHHADPAVDASTGVRFHPIEIALSAMLKVGLVLALGASAAAVVAFEILLNVSSLFGHANVRLPAAADRAIRAILVTPDMHRVHHSTTPSEMNRNFGFALAWWDRLCGTYRSEPAAGHEAMALGLPSIPPARAEGFWTMLVEPLRQEESGTERRTLHGADRARRGP
jgi:sterol desaturase/sphingolipid hydroxylase (fatty acid hydroxylase superfamily)